MPMACALTWMMVLMGQDGFLNVVERNSSFRRFPQGFCRKHSGAFTFYFRSTMNRNRQVKNVLQCGHEAVLGSNPLEASGAKVAGPTQRIMQF